MATDSISFVLSNETEARYRSALDELSKAKRKKWTIKDLKIERDVSGNFCGIIELEK